ncbi:MAG: hypothetical protein ACOX6O_01160 [Christensenellales bacterium]|jgi:hypothetical protein
MKQVMSLLCALLLCLTTMAYAKTHTISVWLDEDAINVTMERWESALGMTMSCGAFCPQQGDTRQYPFPECFG